MSELDTGWAIAFQIAKLILGIMAIQVSLAFSFRMLSRFVK